ncbi:MAG: nucleoside triphosphate hydrolase [Paracoccaceae bacterium]|nr:nucleoside triphosphate hydrolase [Paracoccaceae bacterium]
MTQSTDIARLARHLTALPRDARMIVALAGAPGSGKSHMAEALCEAINRATPGLAAVLPMDGYHYDDAILHQLGRHARKGAPDTFDVAGLHQMLLRLRVNAEPDIAVPVFDRALEISRASARLIPQSVGIILCEGNYLLLDQAPWAALAPAFDLTVLIDVPEATLRDRLTRRWQGYGLNEAQIRAKLEDNDLPNGRFLLSHSRAPDFTLPN